MLSPINEPAALLLNESPNANHWLRIRLIGTRLQRDGIGAHVTLTTSAGRGAAVISRKASCCFFGIPRDAVIEKLSIRWPSGIVKDATLPSTARWS